LRAHGQVPRLQQHVILTRKKKESCLIIFLAVKEKKDPVALFLLTARYCCIMALLRIRLNQLFYILCRGGCPRGSKNKLFRGTRIGIYSGQYFDSETGLHYNYYRYYDPQLGRYLRADPSHLNQPKGSSIPYLIPYLYMIPQEYNSFSYVKNNPISLFDPLGLWNKLSSTQQLHAGYRPPSNSECGCETTFPTCYKRCTWFYFTPSSPDLPSLLTEGATKLFCTITCGISPCAWDDKIFDDSPFWGY
jgi:RHS repeat-associated protein